MLSHITQINKLKPKRIDDSSFNRIETTEDLFQIFEENKKNNLKESPKILKAVIKEGEILYVPSYFFIQGKELTNDNEKKDNFTSLKFEFKSNSRILNTMFKVLYDHNFKLDNNGENY